MKAPLFLAFAIIVFPIASSYAQREYQSGYVINANGDSIAGFVAFQQRSNKGYVCYFKQSKDAQHQLLSPLDIKAFGSTDGERYDSKMLPIINAQVFVKTIIKGKMSLYFYFKELYVETDRVYPLLNSKKNKGQYIETLNKVVADCGLNASAIKYNQKNIAYLVQNYNKCKGGAGVVHNNVVKKGTKVTFSAFYGLDFSKLSVKGYEKQTFNSNSSGIWGGGMSISSKHNFRKLSVSVELAYLNKIYQGYSRKDFMTGIVERTDYTIQASFIKLPIGFNYKFVDSPQSPFIRVGFAQYYLLETKGKEIREYETFGTVITSENEMNIMSKPQRGLWLAVGYEKNVWKRMSLFAECRLEVANGFIGYSTDSRSTTEGFTTFVGLRF